MLGTKARTASAALAEFCGSIQWSALAASVRKRTQELVLDFIGVALRGRLAPSSGPVIAVARRCSPDGGASLIGGDAFASAPWAALANATSAHALELDDVTSRSSLHPGVVVIPTALAMAEEERHSPTRMLAAIVAGYEVTMRIGDALNAESAYRRGFHPTGVAGVFGAAMAAGLLLELDADGLTRALGIAGTMAAGSLAYLSDGSWTKRLNPGWAAHSGIVAAHLASEGFTGPATALDGPRGLLRGYTDDARPELLTRDLGRSLAIMSVSIKPYACCRYNHGLIDAVLELRRSHHIRPQDIERIRLGVLSAGATLVAEPIEQKRAPRNVVDAQFSAPFAAAVALVRGSASLDDYSQANVDDPDIASLMRRTDCYRDGDLDAAYPEHWPARVTLLLRDGRELSVRIADPTGEPGNPLDLDRLREKFTGLAAAVIGHEAALELADRCLHLEAEPDLERLTSLLRGSG
ncbi:MAG TPA: MmgE/PrpD family protein [Candidatus Limnocylindria bacterium]|jgi:2-methylcitrate dehydratase PrpD|nr:MmgE/PrpD family protein [Candidatus Limnocylindria bacterium]